MRCSKAGFLSTLLTGALLCAVAVPSHAFTFSSSVTDMGLLRPESGWHVNAIYVPHNRYCAMANTFDKQISLAFARSPSGYGSLAIAFPGQILKAGAMYQVALQVDDTKMRQYNVRAASAHSLIVQIGRDSAFYKALAGNGTLRIALPEMNMRFDLSRFAGSYLSLIGCADQLHHTSSGPRTAAAPVQPVTATALNGSTQGTAPQSNVAAGQMEAAATAARNRLARAQQDETGLGDKMDIMDTQKRDLTGRLDMQNKQYKLLQMALKGKEGALQSARSMSAVNSKALKDVQAELSSLRQENAKQVADLKVKLRQKGAQYYDLERKLIVAQATAKAAEAQETQDEADLAFLRQQLTQTQVQLVAVEQEKRKLAGEAQKSETLYQGLRAQLKAAEAQIAGLKGGAEADADAPQINIKSASGNDNIASATNDGPAVAAAPVAPTMATPLPAPQEPEQTASSRKPSGGGIFSIFPFSLFHHTDSRRHISSSNAGDTPAIVPASQGGGGITFAQALKASLAGKPDAADPMGDWKTIIVQ